MDQFKQVMQNAMSIAGESNVGEAIPEWKTKQVKWRNIISNSSKKKVSVNK